MSLNAPHFLFSSLYIDEPSSSLPATLGHTIRRFVEPETWPLLEYDTIQTFQVRSEIMIPAEIISPAHERSSLTGYENCEHQLMGSSTSSGPVLLCEANANLSQELLPLNSQSKGLAEIRGSK